MSRLPDKFRSTCLICTHSRKKDIEKMIVMGFGPTEIERQFADTAEPAPRRSVSNHRLQHLDYEQDAIRQIIDKRAKEQGLNIETTTERLIQHQGYLDVVIQKAFESLIDGNMAVEPRDAFKAIELKDKFEKDAIPWTMEKIQSQHNAFLQAVKEIVPSSLLPAIIARARDLYENGDITDAEVVQNPHSSNGEGTLELPESREDSVDGEEQRIPESMDD